MSGNITKAPAWFSGFLAFYDRPERPSIRLALTQYKASLESSTTMPEYWHVQQVLNRYVDHGSELPNRKPTCLMQMFGSGSTRVYCAVCGNVVSVKCQNA